MKLRLPDLALVYGEQQTLLYSSEWEQNADVAFKLTLTEADTLIPTVKAEQTPISFVVLKWYFQEGEARQSGIRVMGDAWERGYGDMEWRGIAPDRCMPWYCLVSNGSDLETNYSGRLTECFGVKVRPSAFCFWQYDVNGITLTMDVRCGARGVLLGERELQAAEILFCEYRDISAYESGKRFCRAMCDDPVFPKAPVYGFNNWYYAYGKSSPREIKRDAERLAKLTKGLQKPYMVIDDGWQPKGRFEGVWKGNKIFGDMRKLASEISQIGVLPGIWVRPLLRRGSKEPFASWKSEISKEYLDPSRPEVLSYIENVCSELVDCGYRLMKLDFLTFDLFLKWGMECKQFLAGIRDDWSFFDRTKTSAEIILGLYRAIRRGAGDAVLIGCNAIGHLCAGFFEVNRTGDDTSGKDWKRTRKMGVNTLAFRSIQNGAFYAADADCVGITELVPWELNERWLYLLSSSGSPLFISWNLNVKEPVIQSTVKKALECNSIQQDELIPLDWMENNCPCLWRVNGEIVKIDWFGKYDHNLIGK